MSSSSSSSSSSSFSSSPPVHHHHLPAHISVQTLNRRAAFHLERDEYEQAIDVLVTALKIWETVEVDDNEDEDEDMECGFSSIDECILQGRHLSPQALFNRYNSSSNNNNNKKESSYDQDNNEGFIYRQPILATSQFWRKDRIPTGNTLSLILILNLAMAHHLSGLKDNRVCKRKLQKALQLYELAHQLQLEDKGFCSPQATMIITNNVGEIHRSVNNHQKHTMCLRHLLSTMMYMVDNNTTNDNYNNTSDNDVWDGFLRNTSQLILQRNCAGAA